MEYDPAKQVFIIDSTDRAELERLGQTVPATEMAIHEAVVFAHGLRKAAAAEVEEAERIFDGSNRDTQLGLRRAHRNAIDLDLLARPIINECLPEYLRHLIQTDD